jgi:uncharacterized protein (TIGR03382 family)
VPLPSLRLKLLRAGVQDYEWLLRVVDGGDPAFAEQVAHELVPAPYQVTLDPDAFERARARLIQRALELAPRQPQPESVGRTESTVTQSQGCGCGGGTQGVVLMASTAGLAWVLRRRRSRARTDEPQVPTSSE